MDTNKAIEKSKFPEKIVLYCRLADEKGILHAFPACPDTDPQTAIDWASHRKYKAEEGKDYIKMECDNTGFCRIQIIDLDIRGEGGRAYQVIINLDSGKRVKVDLRERTLMETMFTVGIAKGGAMPSHSTFCFIQFGAQVCLVREGSEDHKAALVFREVRATEVICKDDLIPGHLYKSQSGKEAVFLGKVFCRELSFTDTNYVLSNPVSRLVFLNAESYKRKYVEEFLAGDDSNFNYWYVELSSSHSYKVDLGPLTSLTRYQLLHQLWEWAKNNFNEELPAFSNKHYEDDTNALTKYFEVMTIQDTRDVPMPPQENLDKVVNRRKSYYKYRGRY